MSKLSIVLCAVLFASTANAFIWTGTLKSVQQSVQDFVVTSITTIQQRVIASQEKARASATEITDKTTKISDNVRDKLSTVMQNVNDDIIELASTANGVDIEECLDMSKNLGIAAVAISSRSSECINNKLKQGSVYIETIDKVSNAMLSELSEIKNKVEHCGDHIYGVITTITAKICAKQGGARAAWISFRGTPQLLLVAHQLDSFLANLPSQLTECSASNILAIFDRESSTIVKRTETCIRQKIETARLTSTTTTVTSTTTTVPTDIDGSNEKEAVTTSTTTTTTTTTATPEIVQSSEKEVVTTSTTTTTTTATPELVQSSEEEAVTTTNTNTTITTPVKI